MRIRVWKELVRMVLHIRNLKFDSLANQVHREQINKGLPGLAKECSVICSLQIEDVNKTNISATEYKKIFISARHLLNKKWLQKFYVY